MCNIFLLVIDPNRNIKPYTRGLGFGSPVNIALTDRHGGGYLNNNIEKRRKAPSKKEKRKIMHSIPYFMFEFIWTPQWTSLNTRTSLSSPLHENH
jgi:hypothetical protein